MKILYLAEDYPYSYVHYNLCQNILDTDCNIVVFYSIRKALKDRDLRVKYGIINYRAIGFKVNKENLYKISFRYKVNQKYKALINEVDLSTVDIVHAATLFSEGALAYRLYKEKHIPYILTVRGSDINLYLKYMFHLWPQGLKILKGAKAITFITQNITNAFFSHPIMFGLRRKLYNKTFIIPNGVDDFWLKNIRAKILKSNPNKLLYIGIFDTNKNLLNVMNAVLKVKSVCPDIHLELIGGGGNKHNDVLKFCNDYPETFQYKGKIYDKSSLLLEIRQNDVFIMPSHSETFGLVYIEALSQGLPLVYAKGQGIDQVFDCNIGEAVNSHSIQSIVNGICSVLEHFNDYVIPDNLSDFTWERVSKSYLQLYKKSK